MNEHASEHRDSGFVIGLLAGAIAGAGLMVWLAPAIAELRERAIDSAKSLREQASARYQRTTTRVGDTVDDLARKGQEIRNDVAEAVVRGAQKVEAYAAAAKRAGPSEGSPLQMGEEPTTAAPRSR